MESAFESVKLDKHVPIPLYYQLKKQVLALIENAAIKEGDILPPESELCALLKVSRPTIRQAFTELVTEGYLNRYKGRGTFVSKPKVDERFFSKLESFNREMIAKGLKPQTRVLEIKKLYGNPEANEHLALSLDAPLIYLRRLRLVDGVPLVYLETFLPFEQYQKLMDVDFSVNSLYDSLEKWYRIRVIRVHREIEAINAPKKEAEFLQIAKNRAVSLVKTVAYSDDTPGPVEFSIARYRGDLNKFSVEVYR
ncbi:MAG: GntR family transcriptional regulator, partial [Treponema sp.]|nr:GntR family transcriptional regulator [Treponema sp.]